MPPRNSIPGGAGLGLLTALPILAILHLGERVAGLPYVPYLLFEWLARLLPGALLTFGIDLMVSVIRGLGIGPTSAVAKVAEMALAVAGMLLLAAAFGALLAGLGRRGTRLLYPGAVGGFALWLLTLVAMLGVGVPPAGPGASALWLAVVLVGWGALLGAAIGRAGAATDAGTRRRFLQGLATAAVAVFAAALGLGRVFGRKEAERAVGGSGAPGVEELLEGTSGPAASPPPQALAARAPAVEGTRPELTPIDRFYRIDINLTPPRLDPAAWRLQVEGRVSHPQAFTLDALRQLPPVSQVATLECISNRLGGDLISTAVFTGVRLKELLARVGRRPEGRAVFLESADGFFESVEARDVEDERTLLVWAMNGEPLTAEHGFPLRISIPDRFGMKQPKWITRLEVTAEPRPGYWVERGWSREARPPTTSVVDAVSTSMRLGTTEVLPVGGIAYAGARGISRVEVQVDDGPWEQARLRTPPLGPLSWVLWRYEWPYRAGRHTFRVRAYDGSGALQPTQMRSPHPEGATGVHELTTVV